MSPTASTSPAGLAPRCNACSTATWESTGNGEPPIAATWAALDAVPDAELWAVRSQQRAELVDFVRDRSMIDRLARGEAREYVQAAARAFDPEVLTIGFARRVATYKRLHLLVQDPDRSLRLLAGERPIQIVLAGKAHPSDDEAKHVVQTIFSLKSAPNVGDQVIYLHDYDIGIADRLVQGCDVWVNLPRPPLEASGTSGMKSVANGGLQLSVLDGWWAEGYDGANGWALSGDVDADHAAQDAARQRRAVPPARAGDPPDVLRARRQRAAARVVVAHPQLDALARARVLRRTDARRLHRACLPDARLTRGLTRTACGSWGAAF